MRVRFTLATVALSCRLAVLGAHGLADWILPSLGLARADYVPEPKPVRTGVYRVGATSFPGWTLHDWHAIRSPVNIAPEDVGLKCPSRK